MVSFRWLDLTKKVFSRQGWFEWHSKKRDEIHKSGRKVVWETLTTSSISIDGIKEFFWIIILRLLQFFWFMFQIFRPWKYNAVRLGPAEPKCFTPGVTKQYKANSNKEDNKIWTKCAPDTFIGLDVSVGWRHRSKW